MLSKEGWDGDTRSLVFEWLLLGETSLDGSHLNKAITRHLLQVRQTE